MLQTLINTLLVFNRSSGTPCIRKISIPQENESIHIFLHKNVTDTCININHLSLRTYKTCNNQKCIVAFNNCQSSIGETVNDLLHYYKKKLEARYQLITLLFEVYG